MVEGVKNGRWAELDHDLLNEIAMKLNYSYNDYIQARSVCTEWKMALPKVPCLVLPFSEDNTLETYLAHRKIYHIRLPELCGTKIRGSSYGWLICVGIDDTLQMIKPLNPKVHFFLPPLSTIPNVVSYHPNEIDNEYLLQEFGDDDIYPMGRITLQKCLQIHKVILSSPPDDNNQDFMAIVIFSSYSRLAFCRRDDTKWIDIPKSGEAEYTYDYKDAIFHEGKIYAIDFKGQLFEYHIKKGGIPIASSRKVPPPPHFNSSTIDPNYNQAYLIGCPKGDLIMVARNFNYYQAEEDAPDCYNSAKFDIYRLSSVNMKQWSRVFRLENGAIFIGFNSSTWMVNHTLPHCQRNKIYYTDNNLEYHYREQMGGHDIGMLNLDEGTICRFSPNSYLLCPPPVWSLY
ncbi:hypothetical protein TanjilG_02048 [Lupinus angustifolius]|nr:hypothetical protein TanjilG_02048 [Lupinus angustifolius]